MAGEAPHGAQFSTGTMVEHLSDSRMCVFVSYARRDDERVAPLVEGLRQLGADVWLDQAVIAGERWWAEILAHIRECDVFIQAVSPAAIESEACTKERVFAEQLGKPLLPVVVEDVDTALLPADLSTLQLLNYADPTSSDAFRLAKALGNCPPAPPLPDPLPPSPDIPVSYLSELSDRVHAPTLSLDEQLALVARLETAAERPDRAAGALELLRQLAVRNDLFHAAAVQIDRVVATAGGRGVVRSTSSAAEEAARAPAPAARPPQRSPVAASPGSRAPDRGVPRQRNAEAHVTAKQIAAAWAFAVAAALVFPFGFVSLRTAWRLHRERRDGWAVSLVIAAVLAIAFGVLVVIAMIGGSE